MSAAYSSVALEYALVRFATGAYRERKPRWRLGTELSRSVRARQRLYASMACLSVATVCGRVAPLLMCTVDGERFNCGMAFCFAEMQRELREAVNSMGVQSKVAYSGASVSPRRRCQMEAEGWKNW